MSELALDQSSSCVQTEKDHTTDNALSAHLGLASQTAYENEAHLFFGGSKMQKAIKIGAILTSLGGYSTSSSRAEEPATIPVIMEQRFSNTSVAESLSKIVDRYESVFFSYSARVVEIEKNASGDSISATIVVSVDGNDTIVKRPIGSFSFEPKPDMQLIVDGVKRGDIKKLAFRIAQPLKLDEEQEDLLKDLVASFRS